MTQGIPGSLSAWQSTLTYGMEECWRAPAHLICDCPSAPGDLAREVGGSATGMEQ